MKTNKKLWIGIGILALLSPLGLLLPYMLNSGSAWGEWGSGEILKMAGYVPAGLAKLSTLWNAPLPDYAFKGWEEKGLAGLSAAYVFSAVAGIVITAALVILAGRLLVKKDDENNKR